MLTYFKSNYEGFSAFEMILKNNLFQILSFLEERAIISADNINLFI